jgi:hypothetical protein
VRQGQLGVNARGAVDAAVITEDLDNTLDQLGILERSGGGRPTRNSQSG